MLEKAWEKIDKFYLLLSIILILLGIMLVVAFRGIFSAYLNAYEIDQKDIQVGQRIEKDSLEEAYTWLTDKKTLTLQIRD